MKHLYYTSLYSHLPSMLPALLPKAWLVVLESHTAGHIARRRDVTLGIAMTCCRIVGQRRQFTTFLGISHESSMHATRHAL